MTDFWNFKNFNNLGKYKNKVIRKETTFIDASSYLKAQEHINTLTDALFIPLSRAVKTPAIMTANCVFDSTVGDFYIKHGAATNDLLFHDLSTNIVSDELIYIDMTLNQDTASLSDVTPLFFVTNTSRIVNFPGGQVPVPRVKELLSDTSDLTCRIGIETVSSGSMADLEIATNGDWEGLSFCVEGLFQSIVDNTDTTFQTASIPYWDHTYTMATYNSLDFYGIVYADLYPDGTSAQWSSKVRLRIQEYDADTSQLSGDYTYTDWPSIYTTGIKDVYFKGLPYDTTYAAWYQIDSQVGPDMLDWSYFEFVNTKPKGVAGDPPPTT